MLSHFIRKLAAMALVTINDRPHEGQRLKITLDGRDITPRDTYEIDILVEGSITSLDVGAARQLEVNGNVGSLRLQSGNVTVSGDVEGSVHAQSGDVVIDGQVAGDVKVTAGNVTCGPVRGNVQVMAGNIRRR